MSDSVLWHTPENVNSWDPSYQQQMGSAQALNVQQETTVIL